MVTVKLIGLTAIAMIAFAANSILCRLALVGGHIDAVSFTSLRLLAGTVALLCILFVGRAPCEVRQPNWGAAGSLFAYMACFSFAYQYLTAGTGALILFGAVQLTMIGADLVAGERLSLLVCLGLALAIGGWWFCSFRGFQCPIQSEPC